MDDFFEILMYLVVFAIVIFINFKKIKNKATDATKPTNTIETDNPIFPDITEIQTKKTPQMHNTPKPIIADIWQHSVVDNKKEATMPIITNKKNTLTEIKNKNINKVEYKEHMRIMLKKSILYSTIINKPYN